MSTIKSKLNSKKILGKNKMLDQKLIRQNERLMQELRDLDADIKEGCDYSIEHPFDSKMLLSHRRN